MTLDELLNKLNEIKAARSGSIQVLIDELHIPNPLLKRANHLIQSWDESVTIGQDEEYVEL